MLLQEDARLRLQHILASIHAIAHAHPAAAAAEQLPAVAAHLQDERAAAADLLRAVRRVYLEGAPAVAPPAVQGPELAAIAQPAEFSDVGMDAAAAHATDEGRDTAMAAVAEAADRPAAQPAEEDIDDEVRFAVS